MHWHFICLPVFIFDFESFDFMAGYIFRYSRCFSCGKLSFLWTDLKKWRCRKCDTENEVDPKTWKAFLSEHFCQNPAFCTVCVGNSVKLNKFSQNRPLFHENNGFCSKCLHNQQVGIMLLANDPPDGYTLEDYRETIVKRYPVACPSCMQYAKKKVEQVNLKFRKSMLISRLVKSKEDIHHRSTGAKKELDLKHWIQRLSGPLYTVPFIIYHGMHVIPIESELLSHGFVYWNIFCTFTVLIRLFFVEFNAVLLGNEILNLCRLICKLLIYCKSYNSQEICIINGYLLVCEFWVYCFLS
jgi:hypothetical protein